MAIFSEGGGDALPLFRELATDERGAPVLDSDGQPKLVSGAEALRTWVRKALHPQSARFARAAYSARYGNELADLAGAPREEAQSRLAALIRAALLVNPYITAAEEFTFSGEGGTLRAAFRIETVYGTIPYESEASIR